MLTNQPILTAGAVLLALVVAGVGGALAIMGDISFEVFIGAVTALGVTFGAGSGYARGKQAAGTGTQAAYRETDPYHDE